MNFVCYCIIEVYTHLKEQIIYGSDHRLLSDMLLRGWEVRL